MLKIILTIFLTLILFPPKYKIRNNIKIIIYLIGIIFIFNNIEGFGTGIDGEALRNIASLYNNADGTLIVKNLKATGNIETTGGEIISKGDITTAKEFKGNLRTNAINGNNGESLKIKGGSGRPFEIHAGSDAWVDFKGSVNFHPTPVGEDAWRLVSNRPVEFEYDIKVNGPIIGERLYITKGCDHVGNNTDYKKIKDKYTLNDNLTQFSGSDNKKIIFCAHAFPNKRDNNTKTGQFAWERTTKYNAGFNPAWVWD